MKNNDLIFFYKNYFSSWYNCNIIIYLLTKITDILL